MAKPSFQAGAAWVLRILVRVLDVLVLLAVLTVVYATAVGIPDALVQRWMRSNPSKSFAFDLQHVRISPLHGLVVDDLRVYRRKQIGPPLLEARRVVIELSLYDGLIGRTFLDGVVIEDGLVRPGALKRTGPKPDDAASRWSGTLALKLKNVEIVGAKVTAFGGQLSVDGEAWRIDDATATVQQGARTLAGRGSLAFDRAGELVGQGTAEGDPAVLNPFLDAAGAKVGSRIINDFVFPQAMPRGEWSFQVPRERKSGSEVRFQVWLDSPIYKGVQGLRAESSVQLSWNGGIFTADIRPLMAVREEGIARGGLTIRTGNGERLLSFDAVSEFDPRAMAQITGVWTNEVHTLFVFEGPYRLAGNGTVNLKRPEEAALQADLGFGNLIIGSNHLQECAFRFTKIGPTNRIDGLQTTWHGGKLTGRAEWYRPSNEDSRRHFRTTFEVSNADFAQIALSHMHNSKSEYSGHLHGRLTLEGLAGRENRNSLRGAGNIAITEGKLFMLPVFGGLSTYLARTIPGLDLVISQSDVLTDFTIEQGRIRSEKLLVEGDVLSLLGRGSCGLDGSLDFDVQLTFLKSHTLLSKILRVPTYIFSKLFEFRLTGTRTDPRWYPINFSKDLWQKRPAERNKDAADDGEEAPAFNWDEPW